MTTAPPALPTVTVYMRDGCHLCDAVAEELLEFRRREHEQFSVEFRDVDREPTWVERYGPWIPVVELDDQWVSHYFFDPDALHAALSRARKGIDRTRLDESRA